MSATESNPINIFTTFGWDDFVDLDQEAIVELEEATSGEVLEAERNAGERLKSRRQKAGLSLRSLAAKVGEDVHFTTIAKLETGRMRLTEAWADRLAVALDIHPADLLADEGTLAAVRKIPVYNADEISLNGDVVEWPKPTGELVSTRGGKNGFALQIEFNLHRPSVVGYVQIDPNQSELYLDGTYLLHTGGNVILAAFVDAPARFVPWIADDSTPDLLIGSAQFRILGRAVELTAKL